MPSTAPAPSRLDRVARFAAKAVVVGFGAFFVLLLGIRVLAYPQLAAHRDDIAHWLSQRIGQPVTIDDIVTGWDGWNPRLSIRGFRVQERDVRTPLFELPRVDLVVAWTSLPRLDLRLKELEIDSPRLSVRRDVNGRLHLAGFDLASSEGESDSAFVGWLLRQPSVIVRDALLAWNDELRRAPQLLLDHVELRVEQRFGHHRVGLTGVPPEELAGPVDIRADLTGLERTDLSRLRGRLYFRLDYADVAAWREWLPLPFTIESGEGALRAWADLAGGQAVGVTADLELADVRTTLADNLPPLAVSHLAGRAQWTRTATRSSFKATQLSLALPGGATIGPTNLDLVIDTPQGFAPSGRLAFGQVELAPLTAIAAQLPLPDAVRADIARFHPQGSVRNGRLDWTGEATAPQRYSIDAETSALTLAAQPGLPGFTNLSARIAMNEHGGEINVRGEDATMTLSNVFGDPLAFDRIDGDIHWHDDDGATTVQWTGVAFANSDLSGTTSGAWHSHRDGPGAIDMNVALSRANVVNAYRYLPLEAPVALRDWLRRAIVKGTSTDARLVLAGDLSHFPFAGGKDGRFDLDVKVHGGTLDYANGWPALTDIAGDLHIEGPHVAIEASSGRVMNAQLGPVHVELPNFHDADPVLRVDGNASGANAQFLDFVASSPVAQWISHATDGATASGDGTLALRFTLPLHDPSRTTIAGDYRFPDANVQVGHAPALSNAAGELLFSERGVRATGVTAQTLGGPIKLDLATEGDNVHIDASGSSDLARVRDAFDVPALARVAGATDWKLVLDARDGDASWTLRSTLAGASVDLPAPIGKTAGEARPLRLERRALAAREDRIDIDYGGIARVFLHRRVDDAAFAVDRALVLLGNATADATEPKQPGVWIRANVDAIDVDAWLGIDLAQASGTSTSKQGALAVKGIDLTAKHAIALGRTFSDLKATARRQDADWRLSLNGSDLAGVATWRAATPAQPNGRVVARLTRLDVPPATDAGAGEAQPAVQSAARWPAVDLVADTVERKGHAIGKLELQAQPAEADWQIRKLVLTNDAGRIDAHGAWQMTTQEPRTKLDVAIDVREAGAFLGRFGWPNAIRNAPTKIEGQVSWAGAPSDFDYPSLAGRLSLHAGAGQFTKLDPGAARLLGILSLQALPRRITLDFRDVFSEGFAFDSIAGNVRIDRGIMHSDDLHLAGPAAAVDISGDVDLGRETQKLGVRVQPSLSTGFSAGAAALFIANPLVGAAVGAGTLLAQKMLNNPFDRLFSFRYEVTGTFDDPAVVRVNGSAGDASAAAGPK
ncbi:MAG TPA: YhdP family protein [Casimicrobiaceae bacterium]|nr:YhdP family protein [Casimicrobiaceae bacterium]